MKGQVPTKRWRLHLRCKKCRQLFFETFALPVTCQDYAAISKSLRNLLAERIRGDGLTHNCGGDPKEVPEIGNFDPV